MNIAVISTGTELLRGGTVNTNLAVLGTELTRGGAAPVLELAVGDREGDLWAALGMALRHAELIVVTGDSVPPPTTSPSKPPPVSSGSPSTAIPNSSARSRSSGRAATPAATAPNSSTSRRWSPTAPP